MGLRIQNNIAAMNAQRNLSISDSNMSKSLEKLSSGFRINKAADDAAGLSISQQMRADITSYKVASRNVSEANSLLQVAEGAMDQIGNMLTRLKELATQAASANAGSNLSKIDAEGTQLMNEIDRIANSTEYAGTKLTSGSFGVTKDAASTCTTTLGLASVSGMKAGQTYNIVVASAGAGITNITVSATIGGVRQSETKYGVTDAGTGVTKDVNFAAIGLNLTINSTFADASDGTVVGSATGNSSFQVGAKNVSANDRIDVSIGDITVAGLTLGATGQLATASGAQAFMAIIDTAISDLNGKRGAVGASQNRLGYASATLATTIENTTAAESVIRDADMAAEMTTLSKNQILMQAGTAMLAQANQAPQQLLSLFR